MTWSSGFTEVTPPPISRMMPAPSWPRIDGGSFAVETVERVRIGAADTRRLDLDRDFAGFRPFQIDLDDL
ncbi:hypothetical protein ABH999_000666 [Bradyrhizobium yuanmingense]